MRIAIDGRPLQETVPGGVRTYTKELISALTTAAPQHSWRIFFNSQTYKPSFYPEAKVVSKKIPNKLLNTSLLFTEHPKLDGWTNADVWISPNLNFLALKPQTKHIQVVHDLSFLINPQWYSKKSQLWHAAIRPSKIFERANHIVCVSQATAVDLISHFPGCAKKVSVVHPGMPKVHRPSATDLIQARKKFNLPLHFFLYFDGGPRKNTTFVLDSFRHFKHTTSKLHQLIIVGGSGIAHVNEKEKASLLKLADGLLYPSLYEGFGFPPLEAMAQGTPVIASWSSSLPEIIGQAGLLVSPYKPHELAHAMQLLANNPKLRKKLAKEGSKQKKYFRWKDTAKQFLKLITEN